MKIVEQTIVFAGNQLQLNNQRSIYWKEENALIFSDVHSGKSAHFRKHGMAIPSYLHSTDFTNIQILIDYYSPIKIIIVGDLIHASNNKEVIELKKLTTVNNHITFILVKGNHDRFSDELFYNLGITVVTKKLQLKNITFVHEAEKENEAYAISGHIHPGIQIPMLKKVKKKFPCFVVQSKQIILPAFSKFTGLDTTKFEKAIYYGFHDLGFFTIES